MPVRFPCHWLTVLLLFGLLRCGNEPYDTGTISVISINDTKHKILYTYQHQRRKLFMFKATSSADSKVLTWSKFYYNLDLLDRIVSDSTVVGYSETRIERGGAGSGIIGDSTIMVQIDTVQMDTAYIVTKKHYEYNGDQLTAATHQVWTGTTLSESRYEFSWQDGNLSETTFYVFNNGVKEPGGKTTVEFDKKNNIYNHDLVFMYTMSLSKLYWLSKNNPVSIKETNVPDLKLKYAYNKFQYPSAYKTETDVNTEFAISYTEIK